MKIIEFTSLSWSEDIIVQMICCCVSFEQIVSTEIVGNTTHAQSRSFSFATISFNAHNPWFIESQPSLDSVTECFESYFSIVGKVFSHHRTCPTSQFLQRLRKIPMVQSDRRSDIGSQKVVYQLIVISETILTDSVAETIREQSAPRQRKSIKLNTQFDQHFNISLVLVV